LSYRPTRKEAEKMVARFREAMARAQRRMTFKERERFSWDVVMEMYAKYAEARLPPEEEDWAVIEVLSGPDLEAWIRKRTERQTELLDAFLSASKRAEAFDVVRIDRLFPYVEALAEALTRYYVEGVKEMLEQPDPEAPRDWENFR